MAPSPGAVAIPADQAKAGAATMINFAPPGRPLRPPPHGPKRLPAHSATGWIEPEEAEKLADQSSDAESEQPEQPEHPEQDAPSELSARLSGWEPGPKARPRTPNQPAQNQSAPNQPAPNQSAQNQSAQQRPSTADMPGTAFGPAPVAGSASQAGPGSNALSGSRPIGTGRNNRGSRSSRSRGSSRRIGGGLVEVPRVPYRDPASAVMSNPQVPEDKRFCGNCQNPVGRGVNGQPGNPDGVCRNCGTSYSFRAKLQAGELIGGQYEVLGAIAHGGLGWIYLARDRNVNDRWVVLKGMIDTGDTAAMAAAVAEKQFLAQVEHPNIVKIYNFVQHPDPQTGNLVGYIVMEYIGGDSLRQIALAHKDTEGRVTPLPLSRVLAYGLEVLPAMGYLHSVGLIYSDLKPDNVIQTDAQVKLIDLGAVRHMDDMQSPIFFTTGYSAPEIASEGPSVASDIYTVGRTLAVLSFDFAGYTKEHQYGLPPAAQVPLFSLFGSYHRLLLRATHPEPDRRFASCEDMADQLTGVLREVLALGTREERPGRSTVFGPEVRTFGAELSGSAVGNGGRPNPPDWAEIVDCLPVPLPDSEDAAAGLVGGLVAAVGVRPQNTLDTLRVAPPTSMDAKLWRARAYLELGELNQASRELADASALDAQGGPLPPQPYDWRISWFRGLVALAARRPRDARVAFDHAYDMVPGELAPKLALAVSAEASGDYFAAARMYELVWRTDKSFVSAAFGLARVYLAQGDRAGALEVLESVPDRSSHYLAAQMAVIAARTRWTPPNQLAERDLLDVGDRVSRLNLDAERRATLSADVLQAAVDWVRSGQRPQVKGGQVLGCELTERGLRFGLEGCFRQLARLAGTSEDRVELVDRANAVRPRTLT
jgi:serine/threonine-protein kinase PknG